MRGLCLSLISASLGSTLCARPSASLCDAQTPALAGPVTTRFIHIISGRVNSPISFSKPGAYCCPSPHTLSLLTSTNISTTVFTPDWSNHSSSFAPEFPHPAILVPISAHPQNRSAHHHNTSSVPPWRKPPPDKRSWRSLVPTPSLRARN